MTQERCNADAKERGYVETEKKARMRRTSALRDNTRAVTDRVKSVMASVAESFSASVGNYRTSPLIVTNTVRVRTTAIKPSYFVQIQTIPMIYSNNSLYIYSKLKRIDTTNIQIAGVRLCVPIDGECEDGDGVAYGYCKLRGYVIGENDRMRVYDT